MKVSINQPTPQYKTLRDLPVNGIATDVDGDTVLRTHGGIVCLGGGKTHAGYYTEAFLDVKVRDFFGILTISA